MRNDWRFFAAFTLLALLLSSAVYIYGAMRTPAGYAYTGIRSLNASDLNPHLARIGQFREGRFFLYNLYTSEPHPPFMIRPVYYLLTIPFALTSVSNLTVFHILRFACGLMLLCFLPSIIRRFEKDPAIVRLSFLVLVFSSGAGWLLSGFVSNPADLNIPESILFLSLGEAPHFSFSLLLLWLGVGSLYSAGDKTLPLIVFFASLFLLWFEHPFDAVTLVALAPAYLWGISERKDRVWFVAGIAAVSLLPCWYYWSLGKMTAFSGLTEAQASMASPSISSLLCAFLPLLPFAVSGVHVLWGQPSRRKILILLLAWILIQFSLVYAPFFFQRRLISGVQFPIAILSAFGLQRIGKPAVIGLVLLLLSFGNFFFTRNEFAEIRKQRAMPFYMPPEYADAFEWIRRQPKAGAVMSAFVTGNFLPAYTGFPVYAGHSFATPQSAEKKERIKDFYRHPSMEFVVRNHVRYVFLGQEERSLSDGFPEGMFTRVYQNNGILIFDVRVPLRRRP